MKKPKFNPTRATIRTWNGHDYIHFPIPTRGQYYRNDEEVATIQSQDELTKAEYRAVMAYLRRAVRFYKKHKGK